MSYDHTPRPHIESHYHIRELIERQEKRSKDREYYRTRERNAIERNATMMDSKRIALVDFHCKHCGYEFKGQAVRQIESDWTNRSQSIAFYKHKCDCGRYVMRYITDKNRDPFWSRSRLVALDRGNHHNDIMQPFETGYNMLYGKK